MLHSKYYYCPIFCNFHSNFLNLNLLKHYSFITYKQRGDRYLNVDYFIKRRMNSMLNNNCNILPNFTYKGFSNQFNLDQETSRYLELCILGKSNENNLSVRKYFFQLNIFDTGIIMDNSFNLHTYFCSQHRFIGCEFQCFT